MSYLLKYIHRLNNFAYKLTAKFTDFLNNFAYNLKVFSF